MSWRKRPLSALAVATSAAGDEDPRRATGGTAIIRVDAGDAGHGRPASSASHASADSSAAALDAGSTRLAISKYETATAGGLRHLVDNHMEGTGITLRWRLP